MNNTVNISTLQLPKNKEDHSISIEKFATLKMIRSKNLGPTTILKLVSQFQSPSKALEHLIKNHKLYPNIEIISDSIINQELSAVNNFGAKIIFFFDDEYPEMLRNISNPPLVLTCLGNYELLKRNIIAVVGTRNNSFNAMQFTRKICRDIGFNNLITVSGMAHGIDTIVHKSSIEHGTIAVLAGGINHCYPTSNETLYQEIAKNGLIISEQPFNHRQQNYNFLQRNRIISGLAIAVVVIEAGIKSGSLVTAKIAIEQNREVFAVPGFPLEERARGVNMLIKEGAKIIESIDDLLNEDLPLVNYNNNSQLTQGYTAGYNQNTLQQNKTTKRNIKKINVASLQSTLLSDDKDGLEQIKYKQFSIIANQILNQLSSSALKISDLYNIISASPQEIAIAISELEFGDAILVHQQQITKII